MMTALPCLQIKGGHSPGGTPATPASIPQYPSATDHNATVRLRNPHLIRTRLHRVAQLTSATPRTPLDSYLHLWYAARLRLGRPWTRAYTDNAIIYKGF